MRFPVNRPKAASLAGLSLLALVAACGHSDGDRPVAAPDAVGSVSGPAADYPVVLGGPFVVDEVTYTPVDSMNYDAVGYAGVGGGGAGGISLAHRTLPLPSYVEVTSLRTGRTILVRAERRGPMAGSNLVELSPGAAAQLGVEGQRAPIRLRRVNPPEPERALLRSGQRAPERMDTPMPLVGVLMRKLEPAAAPVLITPSAPVTAPKPVKAEPAKPAPKSAAIAAAPVSPKKAAPAAEAAKPNPPVAGRPVAKGNVVIQVGAFSTAERAAAAAHKVGGTVSVSGKFHRVQIGRFSSAADAASALAKARAAGYSDARIQRAD